MKNTAGIFLVNKDFEILLCHPTKHDPDFWSIPKGRIEDGEKKVEAALRETFEETNVDLKPWGVIHTLNDVVYKDITLTAFVIFENQNVGKLDFDSFDLKCNSNVEPEKGGYPEMDGYIWATPEDARKFIKGAQLEALKDATTLIKNVIKANKELGKMVKEIIKNNT